MPNPNAADQLSDVDRRLLEIYADPADPGALGGVMKLWRRAKELGLQVSQKHVAKVLGSVEPYVLHRPVRKHYPRNRVRVGGIDRQWEADLVDMSHMADENDGHHFLLTCIDVFSKRAWAEAVKDKSGHSVTMAFNKILRAAAPGKPYHLHTDRGKEFLNWEFQQMLTREGIHHFSSASDFKACVVERFNRTLRKLMHTYLTAHNSQRYLDVLPQILTNYNNSKHRSIGCKPVEVNEANEQQVWNRLYNNGYDFTTGLYPHLARRSHLLPRGQMVRLAAGKTGFPKGYTPNWTREVFKVDRVRPGPPIPVHKIKDMAGEEVTGQWYAQDMQPVERPGEYRIRELLKHRKRRVDGKLQAESLVAWEHLPEKFNRWLKDEELARFGYFSPAPHGEDEAAPEPVTKRPRGRPRKNPASAEPK